METKRLTIVEAEELIGLYFPVHDHGFVSLVEYLGGDFSIDRAARTSYAYGIRNRVESNTLIRSLMRRKHTSPFEMTEFVFHMAMPIFVARQIVRHRTASLNEMSGRYSLMPMLFYSPEPEQVKAQSKKDKQGRDEELPDGTVNDFLDGLEMQYDVVSSGYKWATESDIARELARIDLPLSTYTQWYWKIDGNNLLKALSLRCDAHAQWETRQYFNIIAGMVKRVMPDAFSAWEDYNFYAKTFSKQELEVLRALLSEPDNPYPSTVLDRYGLTKTEKSEFYDKLKKPEVIGFDLDLNAAKTPEYFQEKYRKSAEG